MRYQVAVELDELDEAPTIEAEWAEHAAKEFAANDPEWCPGDGDSCELYVRGIGDSYVSVVRVTVHIEQRYASRIIRSA